jgi:hypothetical protein
MNKWISFVILVSLLFCTPVYAERSLTFGLWVHHYAGDHTEGLDNHLIALEYDGWTGAFFKNSYGRETGYAGYIWHTKKYNFYEEWFIRGNLSAGILAGYGHEHPIQFGMLSPGMYPTVDVGKGKHSIGIGIMPTFWWVMFKVEF